LVIAACQKEIHPIIRHLIHHPVHMHRLNGLFGAVEKVCIVLVVNNLIG
jgi:hypothetical protein